MFLRCFFLDRLVPGLYISLKSIENLLPQSTVCAADVPTDGCTSDDGDEQVSSRQYDVEFATHSTSVNCRAFPRTGTVRSFPGLVCVEKGGDTGFLRLQ